jgi:hypothetical protein
MLITTCRSLEDHDPIVLELLNLAAETMLAHPSAVPPDLVALLDSFAADLSAQTAAAARADAGGTRTANMRAITSGSTR